MAAEIDSLEIKITANAEQANRSLNTLIKRLNNVSTALQTVRGDNLSSLASGVSALASAMAQFNASAKTADFTRLAKNINQLATINGSQLAGLSSSMISFGNAMSKINGAVSADSITNIGNLASAINKLGYKTSGAAIENIPRLGVAMSELMKTLSQAPTVSQNLINMTNALANLARTGSASGQAVRGLSSSFTTFDYQAKKSVKSSFSLASAIGKVYATYWMLFRAFRYIKKAIDISSDITEVQNVVTTTFGKYTNKIEELTQTAIDQFGMSELTLKQVASRFQAMGTAMGFTQGKMSDMSVSLTKLAADMASFYNIEQKDVAEGLASIFTGQTRPLRTYGLDITQANLKQWAFNKGLTVNFETMSAMEKAQLRYNYVLEQTQHIQGDFQRTQKTWANQTRILKENFKELGKNLGGIFINALKSIVSSLNTAIKALNQFSIVVANSLGKIFGWQYEPTSGALLDISEDFEDMEGAMDGATGSAKKLKQQLAGFDELNVLTTNNKGNGGGSGTDDIFDYGIGGEWTRTNKRGLFYDSDLDTLEKLGQEISDKIKVGLFNIKWEDVYSGAKGFGSGLASFLNGLIDVNTFRVVGRTIARNLNTAIIAAYSFGDTFDFEELGEGLGTAVNEFFKDFDFEKLADTIDVWVQGLADGILKGLKTIDWGLLFNKALEFYGALDTKTIDIVVTALAIKSIGSVAIAPAAMAALNSNLGKGLAIGGGIGTVLGHYLGEYSLDSETGMSIGEKFAYLVEAGFIKGDLWGALGEWFSDTMKGETKYAVNNKEIAKGMGSLWYMLLYPSDWIKDTDAELRKSISDAVQGVIDKVLTGFDKIKLGMQTRVTEGVEKVKLKFISFKESASAFFTERGWTFEGIKEGLQKSFQNAFEGIKLLWNRFADWLNERLKLTIPEFKNPITGETLWGGTEIDFGKIPKFATGGFPEDGLFFANHSEIVGGFSNGQTAVANNMQIEAGIEEAAYRGFMRAMSESNGGSVNVYLQGDANKMFSVMQSEARTYRNRTGRPAFPN